MDATSTPANRLDPRAKTAWRLQSAVPVLLLSIATFVGAVFLSLGLGFISPVLGLIVVLGVLVFCVIWLVFVPEVRYRRWRWDVTESEIRLQSGLIVVELTVIPMVRVQHVDTSQGPIMRPLGLSEVHVWTAAKSHVIPALADDDAAALRDRIAVLARVSDDGGL